MMVFWWWCVFLSNLGQMPRFNLYFFLTVYQHNTGLFCKTEAGCCLLPGSLYDNMCRKGHFLLEKHGKHTHIYTPLPKHMKTCSGTACKEISQCFDWAFKLFYFLFFFFKDALYIQYAEYKWHLWQLLKQASWPRYTWSDVSWLDLTCTSVTSDRRPSLRLPDTMYSDLFIKSYCGVQKSDTTKNVST